MTEKDEKAGKIVRIGLTFRDRDALAKCRQEFRLDLGGGGPRRMPDGTVTTDAYVPEALLAKLKHAGVDFKVLEDMTATGEARQKQVGKGDRFEGGKKAPRGLGKKE